MTPLRTLVSVPVLFIAASLSCSAQGLQTFASATVPFDFQLGDRLMPEGRYTFRMAAEHMLQIIGPKESGYVMVHLEDFSHVVRDGALVFEYKGAYHLREIQAPAAGLHLFCLTGRSHRRVIGQVHRATPDQVATVALEEKKPSRTGAD